MILCNLCLVRERGSSKTMVVNIVAGQKALHMDQSVRFLVFGAIQTTGELKAQ